MGRTVVPVRYEVQARLDELERFVKALRGGDRLPFEEMRASVQRRIGAITYANPLDPIELMQWCAILELYLAIERLRHDIDRRDR